MTGTEDDSRCPHCDCPNQNCACILREHIAFLVKDMRETRQEAAFYREMFEQAAGTIRANRVRLGRVRGEDERRLLAYVDNMPGMVRGATKGRLDAWGVGPDGQVELFNEHAT